MQTQLRSQGFNQLVTASPTILPSLLQCDFGNLRAEIQQLENAGIRALHLDVMDGHFVPNFTYGMTIVSAVRKLTTLPLDVHLMMSNPGDYIEQFVEAGADCLTIHGEIGGDKAVILQKIKALGVSAGIAINPKTPLQEVEDLLDLCDLLLIMSVDAGFGGQAFNPVALEKLKSVQETHPELLLEVDGGVNLKTVADCVHAGAQLLVVGSAIFGQDDYRQAVKRLTDAIGR
ncbi:MAG: ribulose-phosphate 3-epimerase [Pirellulales bacterium]